jgi:hypothetical protein
VGGDVTRAASRRGARIPKGDPEAMSEGKSAQQVVRELAGLGYEAILLTRSTVTGPGDQGEVRLFFASPDETTPLEVATFLADGLELAAQEAGIEVKVKLPE